MVPTRKILTQTSHSGGFSLLEISVICMAFSFMVGGFFVGQDMISNSKIKKDIQIIEQVIAATKTFEEKYGALPGDMTNRLEFFTHPVWGPISNGGNGDGRIGVTFYGPGNENGYCTWGCAGDTGRESTLYWLELAEAQLVPLSVFSFVNSPADEDITSAPGKGMPMMSMGYGLSVSSTPTDSKNFLVYGVRQQFPGQQAVLFSPTFASNISRYIDAKLDDGKPRTGNVQNRYYMNDGPTRFAVANCTDGSGNYPVNTTTALCTLRIDPKF